MPNGTLPTTGYLGDANRTTAEFQGGIDELLAYVKTLKTEVDALSAQVIKEAAVRGVGSAAGNVPDTAVLNTRLATTGNLGTAAVKNFGTTTGNLPEYRQETVALGGDFGVSFEVKVAKIGNVVTITAIDTFIPSPLSIVDSASGAIPAWARPTSSFPRTVYGYDLPNDLLRAVSVNTSGDFQVFMFNPNTWAAKADDSVLGITLTYVI